MIYLLYYYDKLSKRNIQPFIKSNKYFHLNQVGMGTGCDNFSHYQASSFHITHCTLYNQLHNISVQSY